MSPTQLAEWYTDARIKGIDQTKLESRIPVIESIIKEKQFDFILDCLRLYLNKPTSSLTVKKELTDAFLAKDSFFKQTKNDFELQILSGGVVLKYLNSIKTNKIHFAQALRTALFALAESDIINKEVIKTGLDILAKESIQGRESLKIETPKIQIDPQITALDAGNLTAKFTEVNNALGKITSYINTNIAKKLWLLDEETNIHWWVFGGVSNTRQVSLAELNEKELSIVAAIELAFWTQAPPGPYSAESLIRKIFIDAKAPNKDVILKDLLFEAAKIEDIANAGEFTNLCPVLFYVTASKELKQTEAIKKFESMTGLKTNSKVSPVQFAFQLYNELVLQKFY